jgi:hypothetical protein
MKICVLIVFLFHDFRKKIEEKNGKKGNDTIDLTIIPTFANVHLIM